MGIPQLNQSCCGCTLRVGTQIIGWLQLVVLVIAVVGTGLMIGRARDYKLLFILMALMLLGVGFVICLLVGAAKESTGMLLAWLIYNLIATILSIMSNIYLFALFVPFSMDYGTRELMKGVITGFIQCYMMLVVYSYYKEIKARPESPVAYTANESTEAKPKDTINVV